MNSKVVPVILSGGAGTRLWPLSRASYPKQFFDLVDSRTMLQATVARACEVCPGQQPLIVSADDNRFLVAEQMRQIDANPSAIILEPVGRNTAPAVAVAALHALHESADAVLFIMPADHVLRSTPELEIAVNKAAALATSGQLVTFGITPTHPETGYGYLRAGEPLGDGMGVAEFVEKPDLTTAEQYVDDGGYYWNSGMFVFRADAYLSALESLQPEIFAASSDALSNAERDLDFLRLDHDAFARCPDDSIDYAVMERAENVAMVPLDAGWSDVGSWSSLAEVCDSDQDGNVVRGDVLLEDSANCMVRAESRLVATLGLKDQVVIETADVVLVADKSKVQDVKKIVQRLKADQRTEAVSHVRVYRPWGSYESIGQYERAQVKRIVVNPGQRLSLQMHHHRAEHWIVIRGTAQVTSGENVFLLSENESTYIPLGTKHRLENPGAIPLELIEVQSGAYLGEDDIVRFEDVYGRAGQGV